MLIVGADPELFLVDEAGTFVSGHDAVPGTKESPFIVDRGAVQVDGVAVEFNIDPTGHRKEFIQNITTVLHCVHTMVNISHPGCKLTATPTAIFSKAYFDSLPSHAKELGCSPDYNAWNSGKANPKPKTKLPMRTGAGHLHLGWTDGKESTDVSHFNDCISMTKQLDYSLYVLSHSWDGDKKRRMLYGTIGSFRPKPYGVEYRVLSNAWLGHTRIIPWLYDAVQRSYSLMENGHHLYEDEGLQKMFTEPVTSDLIQRYENALVDRGFDPLPRS